MTGRQVERRGRGFRTGRGTAFALLVLSLLLMSCTGEGGTSGAEGGVETDFPPDTVAVLHTTQGKIKIVFLRDKAPEHVKNFLTLAKQGYYDSTYFHRVMPGFMIQGGDPKTKDDNPNNDGLGGHSYKGKGTFLKAEFNDVRHVRSIVSMARSMSPDSAGSQFFILVAENRGLDGKYTAFGKVVEGMDVVDRIVAQPGKPIPGVGGANPFEHQTLERITLESEK
jgi:peptidyl-prolyl cis-trans isomerase B (cyclophilin B)